jgi:predicted Rossmann fold flavoprotein
MTPAIVQLTTDKTLIKPLAGIKVEGTVTAVTDKEQRTESGEILFTEYGISGPPVLQVSGLLARRGTGKVVLDLMPDQTAEEIGEEITRRQSAFAHRTCEDLLTGYVNKRLGQTLLKGAGVEKLSRLCGDLTPKEIKRVANLIKSFELTVTGTKGWNAAQVTCGGIRTEDFDSATMESKRHKGLYAAGEVLNVTGDCGGFNLQWAWTSGYLAGQAMGEE